MQKRGKEGKTGKYQLMFKNHPATHVSCSFLSTSSQVVLKLETVQQLPRGDTQTPPLFEECYSGPMETGYSIWLHSFLFVNTSRVQ